MALTMALIPSTSCATGLRGSEFYGTDVCYGAIQMTPGEQLEAEAAKHEENANIMLGAMPRRPSPDDFEMVERIQLERRRAQDKRALAARI